MGSKREKIVRRSLNNLPPHRTDMEKLKNLTDEEITAAALSDPDCPPMTDEQLARVKRVHP